MAAKEISKKADELMKKRLKKVKRKKLAVSI